MILFDQLTGTKTEGGTWSFISGPAGAPAAPSTFDEDVDFSAADDGVYVYRYQVTYGSCTSLSTVTVTVGTANLAANDDCETAINITTHFTFATTTIPSGTTILNGAEIWTQGCEKDIASLSVDTPFSLATSDVWYVAPLPILGSAQFYNVGVSVSGSFYTNGLNQPSLALYMGEAGCTDLVLLSQVESSNSTANLVVNLPHTAAYLYIRVGARGINEGLFDITITT